MSNTSENSKDTLSMLMVAHAPKDSASARTFKNLIKAVVKYFIKDYDFSPTAPVSYNANHGCVMLPMGEATKTTFLKELESEFGVVFDIKLTVTGLSIYYRLAVGPECEALQKQFPKLVGAIYSYLHHGSFLERIDFEIMPYFKDKKLVQVMTKPENVEADAQTIQSYIDDFEVIPKELREQFTALKPHQQIDILFDAIKNYTGKVVQRSRAKRPESAPSSAIELISDDRESAMYYLTKSGITPEKVGNPNSGKRFCIYSCAPTHADQFLMKFLEMKFPGTVKGDTPVHESANLNPQEREEYLRNLKKEVGDEGIPTYNVDDIDSELH